MTNQLIRIVVLGVVFIAVLYFAYFLISDGAVYDFRDEGHRSTQGSVSEAIEKISEIKKELPNNY